MWIVPQKSKYRKSSFLLRSEVPFHQSAASVKPVLTEKKEIVLCTLNPEDAADLVVVVEGASVVPTELLQSTWVSKRENESDHETCQKKTLTAPPGSNRYTLKEQPERFNSNNTALDNTTISLPFNDLGTFWRCAQSFPWWCKFTEYSVHSKTKSWSVCPTIRKETTKIAALS